MQKIIKNIGDIFLGTAIGIGYMPLIISPIVILAMLAIHVPSLSRNFFLMVGAMMFGSSVFWTIKMFKEAWKI